MENEFLLYIVGNETENIIGSESINNQIYIYMRKHKNKEEKDCTQKKTKKVLAILHSLGYTKRAVT